MEENSKFEVLRKNLLKEVYSWGEEPTLNKEFIQKFYKLVELCTFSLMKDEDNFFALFTIQMKRKIDLNMATAIGTTVSLSHFILHFNPCIFLECNLEEMKALINMKYTILCLIMLKEDRK